MRIVIDMQGAQIDGRCRGIGRYTIAFAKAVVRNRGEHEVVLALSGLFPDTIEPLRTEFSSLLPHTNIRVWCAPPSTDIEHDEHITRHIAELIREGFVAAQKPDVVHVPWCSLSSTDCDIGIFSIGKFASTAPVTVSLHQIENATDPVSERDRIQLMSVHMRNASACIPGISVGDTRISAASPDAAPPPPSSDAWVLNRVSDKFLQFAEVAHSLNIHALDQLTGEMSAGDKLAKNVIELWEGIIANNIATTPVVADEKRKPRLALVSPLPPKRTGIADYSAELLPELTHFYDVDIIDTWNDKHNTSFEAKCPIRTAEHLLSHADEYDRVLYHFGNSAFHQHMLELLEAVPGVVVLHDFYLSHLQAHRDLSGVAPHSWAQALYMSHGYRAVRERYTAADTADVVWRYPANLSVLQRALNVIVHSEYSRALAKQWYGPDAGVNWAMIPLLRAPAPTTDREAARERLGFAADDLLVSSFGSLGPTKLNHLLLQAWLASPLGSNYKAHLVFVGENEAGNYGKEIQRTIDKSGLGRRIRITGWADTATFRDYLTATDIAVQLRTFSRGETSAAALDCMNHGVATIVNAHASATDLDLDAEGVWMLPDNFTGEALINALTTLANEPEHRQRLGSKARAIIHSRHAPQACARRYFEAIESAYHPAKAALLLPRLLQDLAQTPVPEQALAPVATCLAHNIPPAPRRWQWLVDVSALVQQDFKTGIQRVVRALLREWIENPPEGFQVEPVYAKEAEPGYRYARQFTSRLLSVPDDWAPDEPIDTWPGDVFIGLDLHQSNVLLQQTLLREWRNRGVKVWFVVYDLLPHRMPRAFPPEAETYCQRWLSAISQFDGVACISRAVADEMREWIASFSPQRGHSLTIEWFHLGANIAASVPTRGLMQDATETLDKLSANPSFLMVGTIEPRKGHEQTLAAFEKLWNSDIDVSLVIVGKQGWMVETIANRLRTHPEKDKRLFWLEGISDEHLEKVYENVTCLIAASYGEGFGLPLIEAARHKLPIIARDIPVFREVAGEHAYYFDASTPQGLANLLGDWLSQFHAGAHPKSDDMPWLTWRESADCLLDIVVVS